MTDISDGQSPYYDFRSVTSFEEVIRLLGGVRSVAALTQRSRSSVWNWRQAGQFPADYYLVIRDALAERGARAEMRLFGFADVVAA